MSKHTLSKVLVITAAFLAGGAMGQARAEAPPSGGVPYQEEETEPPSTGARKARILKSGKATIPDGAPQRIQDLIKAGNEIVGKPYVYGGGHSSFNSRGYDCSGTVSYALKGGRFLSSPLPSGPLMSWGKKGKGEWVTVYANAGHAYLQVAGIRLDTSAAGDPRGGKGPRWRKLLRSSSGYVARHPKGF